MPFGITNSPNIFQELISVVLGKIEGMLWHTWINYNYPIVFLRNYTTYTTINKEGIKFDNYKVASIHSLAAPKAFRHLSNIGYSKYMSVGLTVIDVENT